MTSLSPAFSSVTESCSVKCSLRVERIGKPQVADRGFAVGQRELAGRRRPAGSTTRMWTCWRSPKASRSMLDAARPCPGRRFEQPGRGLGAGSRSCAGLPSSPPIGSPSSRRGRGRRGRRPGALRSYSSPSASVSDAGLGVAHRPRVEEQSRGARACCRAASCRSAARGCSGTRRRSCGR